MRDCAGTAGHGTDATHAGADAARVTVAWRFAANIPRACSTSRDSAHASS